MLFTVGELIEELEQYDENKKVVIGLEQVYGSDFAYDIYSIDECPVSEFYESREYSAVVLREGRQIGTVDFER